MSSEGMTQSIFDLATPLDKKQLIFLSVAQAVLRVPEKVNTLANKYNNGAWIYDEHNTKIDNMIVAAEKVYDRVQQRVGLNGGNEK